MSVRFLSLGVAFLALFALFPAAFAAHTPTVTLTPNFTQGNINVSFTLTVSNAGPDPIRFVNLTVPAGFTLNNGTFIVPAGWVARCSPVEACNSGSFTEINFSTPSINDQILTGGSKSFVLQAFVQPVGGDFSAAWKTVTQDSQFTVHTRESTVIVDVTTPTIDFASPTPPTGATFNTSNVSGFVINVTSTDTNFDHFTLSVNGVNESFNGFADKSAQPDNIYTYQVFAFDRSGNVNSTEARTATLELGVPSLSNKVDVPASPATHVDNQKYQFNITAADSHLDTISFEFNGSANITSATPQMVRNGSLFTVEFLNLTPTTTRIRWYANDTLGNTAMLEQTYVVQDITKPTITAAITASSSVTLTYSEAINPFSVRTQDFAVAGHTVTGAILTPGTSNVTITVADTIGDDERPAVTYTKGTLADTNGVLADTSSTTPADGLPPRLLSAKTGNFTTGSSTNRTTVILQFSENLDGATVSASDFAIPNKVITSAKETSGTVLLILSTQLATDESVTVSLTGNLIRDLAGNNRSIGSATSTDGLSPLLLSGILINSSAMNITFSEPMDTASFVAGDFNLTSPTRAITGVSSLNSTVFVVLFSTIPTNSTPTITVNGSVADVSANTLSGATATAADTLPPAFQSAQTVNTTSIQVTFTESLSAATVTAGDFRITNDENAVRAVFNTSPFEFTFITHNAFGTDDTPTVILNGSIADFIGNAQTAGSITATDGIISPGESMNITLFQGLNFISVPKRLVNSSVQAVLGGVSFTTLLRFDPANGWTIPTVIEPLEGYWINVSVAKTIQVVFSGASISPPPQKSLVTGWTTVGTPNNGTMDAGFAFASVDDSYSTLIGFDNNAKMFSTGVNTNPSLVELMGFSSVEGRGYWIFARKNTILASVTS